MFFFIIIEKLREKSNVRKKTHVTYIFFLFFCPFIKRSGLYKMPIFIRWGIFDGRFGVVVRILAYYPRGHGFESRTFVCMHMSVCIGSGCFYVWYVRIYKKNRGTVHPHGYRYGASACVSVPTISAPILVTDGAHAPYCTDDCQLRHAPRRKLKLETAYHPQREISRMRANPACVIRSAWH
jgi:hypothetical protein